MALTTYASFMFYGKLYLRVHNERYMKYEKLLILIELEKGKTYQINRKEINEPTTHRKH